MRKFTRHPLFGLGAGNHSCALCSGVTLKAVATALGIPIESGTVSAEGYLDFRGILGVDKSAPVGITGIWLGFDIAFGGRDGKPVTKEEVERLGNLTERYCVVLQTLVNKSEISVRMAVKEGGKQEDEINKEMVLGAQGIEDDCCTTAAYPYVSC